MCGIFAYTGRKNAVPILLDGLSSLEYRGYDSAGVYCPASGSVKSVGAVGNLLKNIDGLSGESGIAHIRWATHGEPTEKNAHPHRDCTGKVWVVHNGIIENYLDLKKKLAMKSHRFSSDTDTEVLAHLVEEHLKKKKSFEAAVVQALREVRGTYGAVFAYETEPDKLVAARMGAPVVLGLGSHENFVASDPSPIMRHTKDAIFMKDGEVAVITPDTHTVYNLNFDRIDRAAEKIEGDAEAIKKGGYRHFMLKEIMEEPDVVKNTLRGRLLTKNGLAKLGGLESVAERLRGVKRIIIVGCGTAYYAGLAGEYMLEGHAGLPVEVEVGSEFRYRKPVLDNSTALVAISQSGETADTLEAVREAKRQGILTLGIINAVGSTIARETDAGIYNHAGPEIGVASTKAFISQLTALALLTLFLGRQRGMSLAEGKRIAEELTRIPEKIASILKDERKIKAVAKKYKDCRDFLYMGRTYNYPVALEGALKLKEISYIHAEGYGAGEMKHGPLAMIDGSFPTVAIAPSGSVYEKMLSNIQEIRARKGPIIAVSTAGDKMMRQFASDTMFIPETIEMLSPLLAVVPLQLFAYHIATLRKLDVDRPRNLAKSVTVE